MIGGNIPVGLCESDLQKNSLQNQKILKVFLTKYAFISPYLPHPVPIDK
jgi:hypothetical protein